MGLRGPKPKEIIDTEWSSNLAYAVGLIVTDGCLSKNGRHIIFISKDLEQISNFRTCLNLKVRIGLTTSGYNGNKTSRIQFGSVNFYSFLLHIGITPAKSLTIGEVKIPDEYFFDFLRGCFDGDGCSYSYWDPRWKSSFMFYISFASGSKEFIEWIRKTIARLSNLTGHVAITQKKLHRNTFYQLRYSKYEGIKLVEFLYKNKKSIRLSRKYLKIKRSLGIVRTHKGRVFIPRLDK